MQSFEYRLVDALIEELHVFFAIAKHILADSLQEPFRQIHVVGQFVESHFRLDHPELRGVPGGVGVFGAKGGAESVDVRQRAGEGLARVTLLGQTPVEGVAVIDPGASDLLDGYANAFFELRKHKGISEDGAREAVLNPLGFAAMMVRLGDADGTIGGAVETSCPVSRSTEARLPPRTSGGVQPVSGPSP